ncbi:HAD-IA family hydrolase [Enterovibrio sp. ZSDZ35]|uniref:HAD-IA family hydrolase n=1 Tax=Enterovibrio qingdaonensis TaxID=2899818 RepID=A0ABT5QP19_9GAMM|nr:HAD-IA family hydrolase [Enterovibrio sp. ZSDZ35]MDD1782738.1 HAD-IA family hydrolase [Enterovibrio sp. ZSDZ35]
MLTKYKLVIFDWDGTVMDSVGRIVSSLDAAARLTGGLPILSADELKQMIGLSLDKGYEFLYPEAMLDKRDAWKAHYAQQFRVDNQTPTALYPGVRETLVRLKDDDFLLAVATGKSRVGLDRAMSETNIEDFFVETRTADQTASKPDPLMIHSLLEALDIRPEEAVMVGDTSHDMMLAKNAGIDAIAITWGVHDADTLQAFTPVAVVSDIESLLSI